MAELSALPGSSPGRSFYQAVQAKRIGAAAKGKEVLSAVRHSRVVGWAKGLVSGAWSFITRQAAKLGRVGVVAAGIGLLTSKQGQALIGAAAGFVWGCVDNVLAGAIKVVSWIPFVGKPIAEFATKGRQGLNRQLVNVVTKVKGNTFVKAVLHDGFISRRLQAVAVPFAILKAIGSLLPGGTLVHVIAYVLFAGWVLKKLLDSPLVGSWAGQAYGAIRGASEPTEADSTWMTAAESAVQVEEPGPEIVTPKPEPKPAETVEDSINRRRALREIHAQAIAQATLNYYRKDENDGGPAEVKDAIYTLVFPEFKATDLTNNQAKKATLSFSTVVFELFATGTEPYDDIDLNAMQCLESLTAVAHNAMNVGYDLERYAASKGAAKAA